MVSTVVKIVRARLRLYINVATLIDHIILNVLVIQILIESANRQKKEKD